MDIFEQLRRDEGVKRFPYTDTVGKTTIGVGHNLTDNGLTNEQIDKILIDDVAAAYAPLNALPWFLNLDFIRQAVLVNMMFNLGPTRFLGFHKMLTHMEACDYPGAAQEMLDSEWAKQVGDRAQRLAKQLATGQWV